MRPEAHWVRNPPRPDPCLDRAQRAWRRGALACLAAAACVWAAALVPGQEPPEDLFTESPRLTAVPQTVASPGIKRVRPVGINPRLLGNHGSALHRSAGRFRLSLFGEAPHTVAVAETTGSPGGRWRSTGHLEGQPDSHVLLVGREDSLAGTIFLPGTGVFQIQYAGPGRHRLVELDAESFPGCAGGETLGGAVDAKPDDRVLLAGALAWTNGPAPRNLVRLDAAGVLDPAFVVAGPDGPVHCLALQPDDKLVLGGAFAHVNGLPRHHLARVNPDGSLEAAFNAGSGPDGDVYALALQPDGNILVGGLFATVDGQPRRGIARLMGQGDNSPGGIWLHAQASPDGTGVHLSTTNTPGKTYILEVSADFLEWLPVFTNRPVDGSFGYLDGQAAGLAQRFYRARNAAQPATNASLGARPATTRLPVQAKPAPR